MQAKDPFTDIVQLDKDTKEFTSKDGRVFFVHEDLDTLPIARFEEWERKSIELGFARSFSAIFDSIATAEDLVMEGKRRDAIIELDNLKRGMSRLTKDRHTIALYLCTLFIYEAGEDPFTWNVDQATDKINCWELEYGSGFFLQLAISSVDGYRQRFLSTAKAFSELSNLSQYMETQTPEAQEATEKITDAGFDVA